jgi:RNA 3'-terminal phosphate cyclase (ATP)
MSTLLELDGSFGEGGGQILRTSLSLALLTGRGFHLRNVRAGRAKPGLQPQHLMSVRAAATIGRAETKGASQGSTDLVFIPGEIAPGDYRFDIGTAGATGLVLHTVYLPLASRADQPSQVTLTGGTHVQTSPCYDFLDVTWRAYLALLGLHVSLTLRRPGFYPRGGGVVEAHIQPYTHLRGLQLHGQNPVRRVTGVSAVAGLPEHIAGRQARRAVHRLRQRGLEVDMREETWDGGPGSVLTLVLDTQLVPTLLFGLGARGKPAEKVADEAVAQVFAYLDAGPGTVDAHSADQLVLPLAVAEGPSSFRTAEVTSHLLTNVAVIRYFVERDIACEGEEGGPGTVRIA